MTLKVFGALLIVIGCGGFGFRIAASQRREEQLLQKLSQIIDYFSCELLYHRTRLPALCRKAASETNGVLAKLFSAFAAELELQVSPDPEICMQVALNRTPDLPKEVSGMLMNLGHCLGRFDLDGQLKDLEFIRQQCNDKVHALHQNRDIRLRTYQTLGLCLGAALAIIFI